MTTALTFAAAAAVLALAELYRRLGVVNGYAAKNLASAAFLAGRDEASVRAGENAVSVVRFVAARADRAAGTAEASFLGLRPRLAVFRGGAGCALLPEGAGAAPPIPEPSRADGPAAQLADETLPAVAAALEEAFDTSGQWKKKTAAVLVLHRGNVVAERYAGGFGPATRLAGWSMTKSLTASACGALALRGRLDPGEDRLFPEWADGRARIKIRHLLNMNSGLAWRESYGTLSDVTRMLFLSGDAGAAALNAPLRHEPGTRWLYSSGTTNLLSALLRRRFGTHKEYLDFWYAALADAIGMRSLVLEADAAGNYVGSSFAWATARDWARLGQLYLQGGLWNGQRLLPEGWTDLAAAPAEGSAGAYGAHFWLNRGGKFPSAPPDTYYCGGYQGQYVFIVPSRDAVIVRLGLAERPHFSAGALLRGILAALPPA